MDFAKHSFRFELQSSRSLSEFRSFFLPLLVSEWDWTNDIRERACCGSRLLSRRAAAA